MLSWIFQAYADAFSVATFQPAKRPAQAMDEDRPSRYETPARSSWHRQPKARQTDSDGGEPPLRHAA